MGNSHRPVVKSRKMSLDWRHRSHTIRFRSMIIDLEKINHVKGLLFICQAETVPGRMEFFNYLKLLSFALWDGRAIKKICEN
jgi:hypothetical protein